ncbi:MAG: SUF system Fe-S cluster assembly regulator [Planctomycetota bacterium]
MLRVTRQTDYAVLLLTQFAIEERVFSARDLAARTGLSTAMVSKVLKLLLQKGLLTSQVGAKGGYALARSAEGISMADVVAALEGPVAVTACSDRRTDPCEHEHWCPCRPHWRHINDAIRAALESVSLATIARPLAARKRENDPVGALG